ncbi:hypothetical protein EWI07_00370 [Sporolactobacillus sp. THM7-4]|nr:hypothetical protein EWI07_00370 [Sporolactobacillus sp. THM7-4]
MTDSKIKRDEKTGSILKAVKNQVPEEFPDGAYGSVDLSGKGVEKGHHSSPSVKSGIDQKR